MSVPGDQIAAGLVDAEALVSYCTADMRLFSHTQKFAFMVTWLIWCNSVLFFFCCFFVVVFIYSKINNNFFRNRTYCNYLMSSSFLKESREAW